MSQHLFLFTIGPVQSFIAQARKTIDLKAGSDILSKLIQEAISTAQSQFQAEIIVPYAAPDGSSASMPNRFLAQINIASGNCRAMGIAMQQVVEARWKSFAEEALQNMKVVDADETFIQRFKEQIKHSLEVYWVFEPLANEADYRRAYQAIVRNISAIKNTRIFGSLPPNENGRKCSITGERDALVFNHQFPRPSYADPVKTKFLVKSPVHLGAGEGLSAIVATKRFYQLKGFKSTAGIAAMAFLNQAESKMRLQFEGYRKQFHADDWDEQLLYTENLTTDYFKKHLSQQLPDNITPVLLRQLLKELWAKGKELGFPAQTPYYALLSFDGDQMGRIWAGEESSLMDQANLKAFQKKLAELLAGFARKAKDYLDAGRGQTIYAGGDDFTGFINLHYLFETLQFLRNLFRNEVSQPMGLPHEISFSAGICIAHYKTPLGEVVRNAQLAQDHAKEDARRNAFCIHTMKRSGEVLRASIRWGDNQDALNNWTALRTCVNYMQQGCFSNTFIGSITTELLGLMGRQGNLPVEFLPMIKLELKRLIQRAKIDAGMKTYLQANPQETADGVLDNMKKAVLILLENSPEKNKLQNALNMYQIADFLNRQPDHAN
ncbi:type III-B CRISPR-associated protein Cas10/Cmr2 [Haliscomenobacter hydrossis]|uniref:CRISPR-associated protein, Crm2 family n=1 Tax=Haliscomenobacter hydrossis (strain ATCC 27775 / DSM 1100 / LMG 10767 / O) TaxID=760192 RepID=F4L2J8_HALH1|nr:type III-B CRISPR-associated protein Cas10/Cmr2 [Haliscomenobacter hydrossis]AEE53916.1 CRISPR-associated protein, Crm2 family [Haliscomenobacter hydrossis DSM 1100]